MTAKYSIFNAVKFAFSTAPLELNIPGKERLSVCFFLFSTHSFTQCHLLFLFFNMLGDTCVSLIQQSIASRDRNCYSRGGNRKTSWGQRATFWMIWYCRVSVSYCSSNALTTLFTGGFDRRFLRKWWHSRHPHNHIITLKSYEPQHLFFFLNTRK